MQTITAKYVQREEDWTVTVSGLGKTLNGEASGIIAARDRADQLVEQLAGEGNAPTVVHLLNGSAYEFTSTYMTARLTLATPAEPAASDDEGSEPAEQTPKDDAQDGAAKKDVSKTGVSKKDEETGKPATATVPRKELSREPQGAPRRYAHVG
ncbi:hypothetical protein SAXI111661_20755 [Saccharomonospora xinjiangensis]|uniref:hypothetical protein n=1 Tax=Saccharomonospora xinjiangensis TaxID=75294 RepID=UPI00106FF22E|nr:hypothetical protein [Saccharomonospora xinjiangensis]QBQ61543.1 hypothetical protein EYD13_15985 [Saccharomonospora xinjiangensis]